MQFQGLGQSPSRISSKLATNVPGTIQIDQCNRHKGCSSSSVSSRSTVSTNKGYFQLKHLNYFYFLFLQGNSLPLTISYVLVQQTAILKCTESVKMGYSRYHTHTALLFYFTSEYRVNINYDSSLNWFTLI